MARLPKAPSSVRPQLIWEAMVIGGLERLTHKLRHGDEFSERDLIDMQALDRRLQAFSDALAARVEQARAQGELIDQ